MFLRTMKAYEINILGLGLMICGYSLIPKGRMITDLTMASFNQASK